MLETLRKLKEGVLDILLPKFCVGCGREGLYICKDCEVFLSEVYPEPSRRVVSVWEYEGLMEKLIYKIKFDGCYHIINELVEKALERIKLNLPEDTVITHVPMHKKRERERGFNQSELIARKLCSKLDRAEFSKLGSVEFKTLLEKVRDNRSQVGLGPNEREENVKGAFRVKFEARSTKSETNPNNRNLNNKSVSNFENYNLENCFEFRYSNFEFPQNVLLVDDVYTTGATMNECMRVLRKAGVKQIYGFTLARKLSI